MYGMIARHDALAARDTYHRLVGQQYFLHQFFFVGIATSAIAQIVLRAGTNAFLQVALLQTVHEGHAHYCRQVAVLAIRLLQTVE